MSRIQNILDKAERDGTTLRTGRPGPVAAVAPPLERPEPPIHDQGLAARAASGPGFELPTPVPVSADTATRHSVRLHALLVAGLSPKSFAAEQYRSLRTRLAHADSAGALRTILITSPQKGEGKSITAANLALTMAQEPQRRVVIVEADLRRPSLQQLFGLPHEPGLADYLAGTAELGSIMKFLPEYNLTVIAAGTTPTNPAELLGSTAMRRILDHLRTRFDRVVIDTPPVLPLADVAILAPLVDGSMLVVRAGHTPKPAIEDALRAFDSSRLIGVVLNEADINENRYESTRH